MDGLVYRAVRCSDNSGDLSTRRLTTQPIVRLTQEILVPHNNHNVPTLTVTYLITMVAMIGMLCSMGTYAQSDRRIAPLKPGVHTRSMQIDGAARRYRIYVPKDAEKPNGLPMVVLLHGLGVDGETVAEATEMDRHSSDVGYILVCPDAGGPDKRWNTAEPDPDKGLLDDVKFLTRLIAVMKTSAQVDRGRVHMVGYSSGATMSYRMALTIPEELASVVAVCSTPEAEWLKQLRSLKPIPLMIVAGEDDTHTPYRQQLKPPITRMTVKETIANWVRINKCKMPPAVRKEENGGVTIEEYTGSSPQSRVTLLTVHRSEHDWPGTTIRQRTERPALHGVVQDEIWRFCRRQAR